MSPRKCWKLRVVRDVGGDVPQQEGGMMSHMAELTKRDGGFRRGWGTLTLVTGLARSGTTWLGDVIAQHPECHYIFEPYSHRYHPHLPTSEATFGLLSGHLIPEKAPVDVWAYSDDVTLRLAPHSDAMKSHLAELARRYFPDERIDHLVVKQPQAEKVGWLADTIGADRIIWIKRHPGGVLNSYIKIGAIYNWSEPEFDLARRTIERTYPHLEALFSLPRNATERAVLLLVLKERIAREQLVGRTVLSLEYEKLCIAPVEEVERVFRFLGVEEGCARECLEGSVRGKPRASHLKTNVDSQERAVGWIHELSPAALRALHRMRDLLCDDWPLPGSGMPRRGLFEDMKTTSQEVYRTLVRIRSKIPVRRILGIRSKGN